MERRVGNVSDSQKKALINFMEQHENLIKGKFSPNFSRQTAKKLWEEISDTLNSIPGAKKDAEHWKRTWFDLRKNAKKKNTEINKYARGTGGGGPPPLVLTNNDEAILNLMSQTAVEGDNKVVESVSIIRLDDPEDDERASTSKNTEEDTNSEINSTIDLLENEEGEILIETEAQKAKKRSFANDSHENNKFEQVEKKPRIIKREATKKPVKFSTCRTSCSQTQELITLSKKKYALKKAYYQRKCSYLKENTQVIKSLIAILEDIRSMLKTRVSLEVVSADHSYI